MQKKRQVDPKRSAKIWTSVIIIGLMVLSVVGFIVPFNGGNDNNPYEYNGITFTPNQNVFLAKIDGRQRMFYTFPTDLLDIPTYAGLNSDLAASPVYILTFDPNTEPYTLQLLDSIRLDFDKASDKEIYSAITEPSDIYALPVVTCDNSTASQRVIYFMESTSTDIIKQQDCIILQGSGTDFLRLRDDLIMHELGVI